MTEPEYLQPINTVAQCLNLTPRRIRQFIDDGNVPRLGRGCVDLTFTMYFHIGSLQVSDWSRKPRNPQILVALAWLSGFDSDPSTKDIDLFAQLFKRNGFTRDDALRAIGQAEGLLNQ